MINTRFLLVVVFVCLLPLESVFSLPVRYGSQIEKINIYYGKSTILRFNEPVKTISNASKFEIKPTDETDPNYSILAIKPREQNSSGEINFILSDGEIVRVLVKTLTFDSKIKAHSLYDFIPRKDVIPQSSSLRPNSATKMELLRAMVRGDKVTGYKIRNLNREVNTGESPLKITLKRIYTSQKYNGYIFQVKNTSSRLKQKVDLEAMRLGNPNTALLSQVDRKVLRTGATTTLRIVALPTSLYYNVNLPHAPLKRK